MDQDTGVFHGLPILPASSGAPCTTQATVPTAIMTASEDDHSYYTAACSTVTCGPETLQTSPLLSQDETISATRCGEADDAALEQRMEGMWPSQQQHQYEDDHVYENKAAVLREINNNNDNLFAQSFCFPTPPSDVQLYSSDNHFGLGDNHTAAEESVSAAAVTAVYPAYYDQREAYSYNNSLPELDFTETKQHPSAFLNDTVADERQQIYMPHQTDASWNQLYYNHHQHQQQPRTTALSPCTTSLVYPNGPLRREDTVEAEDLEMEELWWPDDETTVQQQQQQQQGGGGGRSHSPSSSPPATTGGGNNGKVDEPYAQLIYRAFMSKPNKSMTLQEIYQWFRENTDKAKSEGKGWQNSIRHNLSMNLAFTKRNSKAGLLNSDGTTLSLEPTSPNSTSGVDGRKSTEWFLEPDFYAGVESTTRYRKGNANHHHHSRSSRSTTTTAQQQQQQRGINTTNTRGGSDPGPYSDARVSAGRKGGNVAAQNRRRQVEKQQRAAARMQLLAYQQQQQQSLQYPPPPPPQQQQFYQQQQNDYAYGGVRRSRNNNNKRCREPTTPPPADAASLYEPWGVGGGGMNGLSALPPPLTHHYPGSNKLAAAAASTSAYLPVEMMMNPLGGGGGFAGQPYTYEDVAGTVAGSAEVFDTTTQGFLAEEAASLFGFSDQ